MHKQDAPNGEEGVHQSSSASPAPTFVDGHNWERKEEEEEEEEEDGKGHAKEEDDAELTAHPTSHSGQSGW